MKEKLNSNMTYENILAMLENLTAESFEKDKYMLCAALVHGIEPDKQPQELITAVTLAFMLTANSLDLEICDGEEEEFDGAYLCSFFVDSPTEQYFEVTEKFLKQEDNTLFKLFKSVYDNDFESDEYYYGGGYDLAKKIEKHEKEIKGFVVTLLRNNAQCFYKLLKNPLMPLNAAMREFAVDLKYVVDAQKLFEELMLPAAEDSDAEAQYEAYLYYSDRPEPLIDESMIWLERSAKNGFTAAQSKLGFCLLNEGKYYDKKGAIQYLTIAAEKDDLFALEKLGKIYIESAIVESNVELAIKYFQQATKFGSESSCLELAYIYLSNKFGRRDFSLAVKYLRNAVLLQASTVSDEAVGTAAKVLSVIYERIAKNQTNKNKELEYYCIAAVLGSGTAYAHLNADFPLSDNFVDCIDKIKTLAESGNPEAKYFLGLEVSNRTNYIDRGKEYFDKAIEVWEERAANGDIEAQVYLGECYLDEYNHRGGRYDVQMAIKLFTQATENGNSRGWYYLGYIFLNGRLFGLKNDYRSAADYFERAAKADDKDACKELGEIFEKGRTGVFDLKKAMLYYERGGKLGNTWCYRNLDYIERTKLKNPVQARIWRIKAAENGDRIAQFFLVENYFKNDEQFSCYLQSIRNRYERFAFYDGLFEEIKHKLPHS